MRGSSSSSLARAGPISRGNVHEAPESHESAMPANEVLSPAPSAAMRKSHASAKDNPAPAATPLSAAMTGLFIVERAMTIGL